jgi:N-acetylglucosaminyl-diphospho-decaprenol L-rhamnosyltransferase
MRDQQHSGDIDVVIPTWDHFELLDRCLTTLSCQTAPHTVIVVDNGSTDGTPQRVRERFPGVRLITLATNAGFAPAVNRGFDAGSAPYVVLVNNDVELDPAFLARIVEPLREDARLGSVAGLMLVPGRETVDSYGIEVDPTLAAFNRFAGTPYRPESLHERGLAGPSGGAAAYRRTALEQVGGFDEAMFAYMEDVDLDLRLRTAGWQTAGARDAVGVHLGSASFGPRSRWQVEVSGASRAYLLRKYAVLSRGYPTAVRTLTVELAVVIADAASAHDLAAVRGRINGWRGAAGRRSPIPAALLNRDIGIRESIKRRSAALGTARRARAT